MIGRPKVIDIGGVRHYAFTQPQFDTLMMRLKELKSYRLRLKLFEGIVDEAEKDGERYNRMLKIAAQRYLHYERSYDLLEKEWLAVNREKNRHKYRRRWAQLWKPLGLGTLLTVVAGVAIANK